MLSVDEPPTAAEAAGKARASAGRWAAAGLQLGMPMEAY